MIQQDIEKMMTKTACSTEGQHLARMILMVRAHNRNFYSEHALDAEKALCRSLFVFCDADLVLAARYITEASDDLPQSK